MQRNASWHGAATSRAEGSGFSPTVSIVCANLKGNVGDLAILDAMIRQLVRHHPGRVIEVFDQSRLPVDEDRFRVFMEGVGVPFTYMGPIPNLPIPPGKTGGLGRVLRKVGWDRRVQGRQVGWAAEKLQSVVTDSGLEGHEAVYFAGGAQWSGGDLAVNMFGLLRALRHQGVEVKTFPFSICRSVRRKNSHADLRRYFSALTGPILVRDRLSQATLRRVGVDSTLMPDVVFSLPAEERPKPPNRSRPRVGFAVAECEGRNRSEFERVLGRLTDGGIDPVLVTTCVPEDGDVVETLAAKFDLPMVIPLGWQAAVRQFQSFDLLISNRLHGLIFAFLGGTPAIPLVNREKVAGVASDAALSHRAEQIDQITPEAVIGWVGQADDIVAGMIRYRNSAYAQWDSYTLAQAPTTAVA